MNISVASIREIEKIEKIYSEARAFMRKSGNLTQWAGGYPRAEVIEADIKLGRLFAVREKGELLGVFYFNIGPDETYLKIYRGEWLCPEREYGVIHRVAISEAAHGRGVGALIFEHCFSIISNLRIDTHRDNLPMRRSLIKNGFSERGIIYLKSGDERIAYQKV